MRHLLELQLFEGSLVTLPMNREALVTAVKADSPDKLEQILKQLVQLRRSLSEE